MTEPTGSEPTWTVGDLAAASGLTVRVLRHWEAVGVLSAARTASGHRRYGPAQVTRLHRALALRRSGLGLAQVAALLDEQDPDPVATIRRHVADLDTDLRRRTALRDRLVDALAELDRSGPPATSAHPAQTLMKVIETMTMFEQYVHGYHPSEGARLRDQAEVLLDLVHHDVHLAPGTRVLEIGCGVGAQTVTLLERNPGIELTCVDVSADSLALAERRVRAAGYDGVRFVLGDVLEPPRADGTLALGGYDHVFVCFLLEHLPRPEVALAHLRALLRPGGTITVVEGDHGSAYFHPDSESARDAVRCQVELQRLAGGDALIGRRLYPLLDAAGFAEVAVTPRQVYVDASRPALVEGFIRRTFTAMVAAVREQAVAAGLSEPERFDRGIRDLERTAGADGVFCYTFFAATALSAG